MPSDQAQDLVYGSGSKQFWGLKPEEQVQKLGSLSPKFKSAGKDAQMQYLGRLRQKATSRGVSVPAPAAEESFMSKPLLSYGGYAEKAIEGVEGMAKSLPSPKAGQEPSGFKEAGGREAQAWAGLTAGLAKSGIEMTSPKNLLLLAGTFGLGKIKKLEKIPKLVRLAQLLAGGEIAREEVGELSKEIPAAQKAWKDGDWVKFGEHVGRAFADATIGEESVRAGFKSKARGDRLGGEKAIPPEARPGTQTAPPPPRLTGEVAVPVAESPPGGRPMTGQPQAALPAGTQRALPPPARPPQADLPPSSPLPKGPSATARPMPGQREAVTRPPAAIAPPPEPRGLIGGATAAEPTLSVDAAGEIGKKFGVKPTELVEASRLSDDELTHTISQMIDAKRQPQPSVSGPYRLQRTPLGKDQLENWIKASIEILNRRAKPGTTPPPARPLPSPASARPASATPPAKEVPARAPSTPAKTTPPPARVQHPPEVKSQPKAAPEKPKKVAEKKPKVEEPVEPPSEPQADPKLSATLGEAISTAKRSGLESIHIEAFDAQGKPLKSVTINPTTAAAENVALNLGDAAKLKITPKGQSYGIKEWEMKVAERGNPGVEGATGYEPVSELVRGETYEAGEDLPDSGVVKGDKLIYRGKSRDGRAEFTQRSEEGTTNYLVLDETEKALLKVLRRKKKAA